ncbi:galactoside alpha-(1,2)-fucosyltransferase 1 isoform X2 [Aplysia californica]|uniref:L-Fucosyltransferase n=1 Tax=Aplysia californica TaxID=6500 RepID=A0ABM0JK29_APLCA|nr:galactoside alpha-(1,2)-fucosyltransferase 1 isoform X2 [Aplysia californica]
MKKRLVQATGLAMLASVVTFCLLNGYLNDHKNVPATSPRHIGRVHQSSETTLSRLTFQHQAFNQSNTEVDSDIITEQSTTKHSTRHLLLTFEPYGRLGNAMFQYAGLLGIAKMNNRTPFVLPGSVLTRNFNLSNVKSVAHLERWLHLGEPRYAAYNPAFKNLPEENLVLQAYLQSYKYFYNISSEIKREFHFLDRTDKAARKLVTSSMPSGGDWITVGVHVRRGDKLTRKELTLGEVIPTRSYFRKAMDWMRDKHGHVVFLVATDDTVWTKANVLGSDVVLLPLASADVHMAALSKCNHVIMSVGTFGWWAGYFSDGDVIYFNTTMKTGSPKSRGTVGLTFQQMN